MPVVSNTSPILNLAIVGHLDLLRQQFKLLRQTLDRGEAEAIALALQLQAEWILLDERDGRKVAKSLGLQVTGVLGVLLRANQSGAIVSLQPVLEDLTQTAGFRIAPELLAQILQA